jgi:hypothetical protein
MERTRTPEILTSIFGLIILLSISALLPGYLLRPARPPSFLAPDLAGTWHKVRNGQWQPIDSQDPPDHDWTGDDGRTVFPTPIVAGPEMKLPAAAATIQLPWSPLEQYRYYCEPQKQYYPDVKRCPVRWQTVVAELR